MNRGWEWEENKEHRVDICFLYILNCFHLLKYMRFSEVKIKMYCSLENANKD